ncbi:alpha-glucosidase [Selenomonas sp.]|uniref:alpha-glucosidase n=1 Tax=Selenomonas sp. TaxID=2053611 RepID=UPI0025E2E76E|nr:alpha-glucosidase [Selenomonas sp.]MCI6285091.1 alpha-glucosidase [Selenomonas sp.]
MKKSLKWWQTSQVYQIYPKSFLDTTGSGTGDLNGITARLDYLKTLGVGAVWMTPVYPSPMVDNGYDIADYTAIDPSYGTMEDMERLIAEAKKRGIRIVMDLVYNHSSDQHPWFLASKKDRTNPKADWYVWRDAKPDGSAPTNWRSIFGGSAWTWCEERQQYYLHTFAPQQPDLNWANPDVRQALYDAANFWLDKGVGGFRIDAIVYIKKPEFKDGQPDSNDGLVDIHAMEANTTGILDYLHEFKENVFDGHDIFTVGEANGVPAEDLDKWVGDNGVFDMLFEFSHMDVQFLGGAEVWCHAKPWPLTALKKALTASQTATANNGWYPIFFENHDQPRCINHFLPEGADRDLAAKGMATVLMTLRGTPFIYEGQEIGMANVAWGSIECYNDLSSHNQYRRALAEGHTEAAALHSVHRFSRDNARTPMQWTRGTHSGFTTGLPWLPVEHDRTYTVENEAENADSVLSYYRRLAKQRAEIECLTAGDYTELLTADESIYAFRRTLGAEATVTLVNFTAETASYDADLVRGMNRLVDSYPTDAQADEEPGILRPFEAVVYTTVATLAQPFQEQ